MQKKLSPADALNRLIEGNQRFTEGKSGHPHSDPARPSALRGGQSPFATIITCSDSRVPPEIIFDCGIGDLFVIRVGGNIIDQVVLGSILYATEHLSCPLVVILGHESCGAVISALQPLDAIENEPPAIKEILTTIRQNIPKTLAIGGCGPDEVQLAVEENVGSIITQLHHEKHIAPRIADGRLMVVPGIYMFGDGKVTWENNHVGR